MGNGLITKCYFEQDTYDLRGVSCNITILDYDNCINEFVHNGKPAIINGNNIRIGSNLFSSYETEELIKEFITSVLPINTGLENLDIFKEALLLDLKEVIKNTLIRYGVKLNDI